MSKSDNEQGPSKGQASLAPWPLPLREGPSKGQGEGQGARVVLFDVIGAPVPEPRPRATVVGKRAKVYVPSSAHTWKHGVRAAAIAELAGEPLLPPGVGVAVVLAFRMPRPKSHVRTNGMLKDSAPARHTARPDIDNLAKAVLDALGSFDGMPPLVWCDDSQVVAVNALKRYVNPGEQPGVFVGIMELGNASES